MLVMRTSRVTCLLVGVLFAGTAWGQGAETGSGCRDDLTANNGYAFRSVHVKTRYLPELRSPLPQPGAPYSPATVTEIVENVYQALKDEANRENVEGETEQALLSSVSLGKGKLEQQTRSGVAIGMRFVTSCTKVIPVADCEAQLGATKAKCVDVSIHAISLRIDTGNPLMNLLNIPRSNRPSFLSRVPGPLLALNPQLGITQDRQLGPTAAFGINGNLLDLGRNLKREPLTVRPVRLDVRSTNARSMNGSYYDSNSQLSLSRTLPETVAAIAFHATFRAQRQPRGDHNYFRNALSFDGSLRLKTNVVPFEDGVVRAGYRRSSNRLVDSRGLTVESFAENAFEGMATFDGRLLGGVSRLAIWADGASPANRKSYQRLAMFWAYHKEIELRPSQTLGIETLLGAGRAWGNAPEYARFYGGNTAQDFLYEPKESPVILNFPTGPLIRSFGAGQASARVGSVPVGATSFWNFNLNLAIPVRKWSSPLVPDISIELPKFDANGHAVLDDNGEPVMEDRPLRNILKSQGESSRKVLERIFKQQGMPAGEAAAKAQRELRSINSILNFVADRANIYAVKPLFMFDAARLAGPGVVNGSTRMAFGGGLQFTIVVAKFEAGYLRTVRCLPADQKGNFVMRLVFENLF